MRRSAISRRAFGGVRRPAVVAAAFTAFSAAAIAIAAVAALGLLSIACAPGSEAPGRASEIVKLTDLQPTVILISIDGFRFDFRDRGPTPNLDALVARGVSAEKLIPVFPTKTFPNHYTIVTGLYPAKHGLVANNMWDPVFKAGYSLSNREEVGKGRWYEGEPIWVNAERQGQKTAPFFWPGSEAEIGGVRPSYWAPYDGGLSNSKRVDGLLALLDKPAEERPTFFSFYMSDVDDAAHDKGPLDSRALRAAIVRTDTAVGRLLDGLRQRGIEDEVDILVVSDHGMSATGPERVILLDELVDPDVVNVVDWNPVLALWPPSEKVEETYAALAGKHPHLAVYRPEEIPARLHFSGQRRIAPILGIADDGWTITTSRLVTACRSCIAGGTHGYDPAAESMGALFIAAGPSFRRGLTVEAFENVHIYELMCRILGLAPAPNDGDPAATAGFLDGDSATHPPLPGREEE